jgi:hypothetical protein
MNGPREEVFVIIIIDEDLIAKHSVSSSGSTWQFAIGQEQISFRCASYGTTEV